MIPYMGTGTTIKTCDGIISSEHGKVDLSKYPNCIAYKPDSNYVGFDRTCIIVCNNGVCDTVNIDITVLPKIDTLPKVTPEDQPIKICVPEITNMGTTPVVMKTCSGSTSTNNGNISLDPATGCVTYMPLPKYVGKDTACIIVCNNGVCDTTLIPIEVTPIKTILHLVTPEDKPITVCKPVITDMGPGATMSSCTGTTTRHGKVLLNETTGCFTFIPDSNYVGNDTACIIVCNNGICDTTLIPITVTPIKDTLPLVTPEDQSITVCKPAISNMGSDATITTCSGSTTTSNGNIELDATTGCFTYNPAINFVGRDTACIIVCNNGICDTTFVPISVTPKIDTIPVVTPYGRPATICTPQITDMGANATIKTCDGSTSTQHGSLSLSNFPNCITYTPTLGFVGYDTACIVICSNGVCDTTIIPIRVLPKPDTSIITREDSVYNICVPMIPYMGTGTTINTCEGATSTAHGKVDLSKYPNCISYKPDSNYVGFDQACIIVCNNGVCDTVVIDITVLPKTDTLPQVTPEDQPLKICVPEITNMGILPTIMKTCNGSTTRSNGKILLDPANGCITYTPSANFVGNDTACIIVCNNGVCDTTIIPIFVAPIKDTLPLITQEDQPITVCKPIITNMGNGSSITTCNGADTTSHGKVLVDATTGCITFTPNSNFVGKDAACIVVCNNGVCDTTTVLINVTPVTDTLPLVTQEDQPITVCKPFITDMGIGSTMNTCSGSNTTRHGTISLDAATGCFTYTPDSNYIGIDTACLIICNNGVCDTTIITIIITPVKDTVPVITTEDTPITICKPLISDMDIGSTMNSCNVSYATQHGKVKLDAISGCFTYIPDSNYVGNDTVCIIVCNNVVCDTTVFSMTVKPVNDTLQIVTPQDASKTICVPEITSIGASSASIKTCGETANTPHGSFDLSKYPSCIIYTPSKYYVGKDTGCIIVCNDNVCDTTLILIDVTPLPIKPKIDLRKTVDTIISMADGNYLVRFKIRATNPMAIPVDSVVIQDDLTKVFPSINDYNISTITVSGTLVKNNLYNGSSVIDLVTSASTLGAGKSDSVFLSLIVKPSAAGKQLNNVAIIQGKTPFGNPMQSSDDPTINPADTSGNTKRDATPFVLPIADIIIPGGFSPNNDGVDDYFVIKRPVGATIGLLVFNRWGNPVYSSNNYQNDWGGRGVDNFLGDYVPKGTYFYVVTVTDQLGEIKKMSGSIMLLR
jgi:gliding motility-associated-like protein